AANKKLEALAKKHKIESNGTYGTPPLKPDEQAQGEKADLSKLSGKEFDQAYAKEMVQDHEKAVSLFQDEAKNGKDKDVSRLAGRLCCRWVSGARIRGGSSGRLAGGGGACWAAPVLFPPGPRVLQDGEGE